MLHDLLQASALRCPEQIAVEDPAGRTLSYAALDRLSGELSSHLSRLGVSRGARVGLHLPKSADTVAALFGVLKSGAAYVPVDITAPSTRNAFILHDCGVALVVVDRRHAEGLAAAMGELGPVPPFLVLDLTFGDPLGSALREAPPGSVSPEDPGSAGPDDLAYVLYTSGSTGRPKGVMLSHRNAESFVDWCSATFAPRQDDRFSSHAPFHFDLSVLDIFVSIKHGATLVLIGEEAGKQPLALAPLIAERRISVWYSAPSTLSVLAEFGRLERHDTSALRLVLFAGEVFPIKHLRRVKALLPRARFFNLYGPTETNVCTYHEIPEKIEEERTEPFPIGRACEHLATRVVGEDGAPVPPGQEGELVVSGPAVMRGYWNLPERTASAFLVDGGLPWYRTGDVVTEADGVYTFLGRRDRMVKKRGYRIELGEIEAGLYTEPSVREAAVIALSHREDGVKIKAFLSCRDGRRPSLIELKRFCSERLPLYMVPDLFAFVETLPKTSTGKVDYQRLSEIG